MNKMNNGIVTVVFLKILQLQLLPVKLSTEFLNVHSISFRMFILPLVLSVKLVLFDHNNSSRWFDLAACCLSFSDKNINFLTFFHVF